MTKKIAICLSGQGAQYPGMGKEIFEVSAAAQEVFRIADSIREKTSNQCFSGTKEELTLTVNTQPCLFAVDLAISRALLEIGIVPTAVAGFSVGEIPALALAKALSDEDAMRIVTARGEYMNECGQLNKGAMAAIIGLDAKAVEEACSHFAEVWPVNYNSPTQTVVAGNPENIDMLCARIPELGGKAIKLNVSGAFHTPYMMQASIKLEDLLEKIQFSEPETTIYANSTARPYADDYGKLLSKQVVNPVLWCQIIENMFKDLGIEVFIEAGPGKALSGMIKKILPSATVFNCEKAEDLENIKKVLC